MEEINITAGEKKNDNVVSPKHYQLEGLGIESVEVIKSVLGKKGFTKFCLGNVLKYTMRAEKKNGLEDYKKARHYLQWLIEECENEK